MICNKIIPTFNLQLVEYASIPYEDEDLRHPKGIVQLVKKIVGDTERFFYIALYVDPYLRPLNIQIFRMLSYRPDGYFSPAISDLLRPAILSDASGMFIIYNSLSEYANICGAYAGFYNDIKKAASSVGLRLLDYILLDLHYDLFSFSKNEDKLYRIVMDRNIRPFYEKIGE